ncbi:MAG: hypothetical protein IJR10_05715 [Clostridia bacterium]|nr:hypothetical protein [Clostridia bacterium]
MADNNKTDLPETEETTSLVSVEAPQPEPPVIEVEAEDISKKELRKEKREKKRRYGEVMTTGSFIRTFLLLLIPGINILCVIFWAIGAAKNRNKVNLSRGLICFFLIEVLLALVVAGVAYIYADQREDAALKYLDNKTNGLITYLDIGTYKDLPKILGVSKFLVEKEQPKTDDPTEPEPEPEPVIPKTCYAYNPEGIDSIATFSDLFEKQFDPENDWKNAEELDPESLFGILNAANVDYENYDRIYIILDNEDCNCVIIFNPEGSFDVGSSFPAVSASSDYVVVGGAK